MKFPNVACFLVVASISAGAHAVSSAEFYTSKSYQYGRFEARVQFPPGDGVVGSFFLWKNGSEVSGTFWNELDFEKTGANCQLQTNAAYGNPVAYHSEAASLSSSLCDQFHIYAYEWTPDYIAWLVDGVEIRRDTGDTATAFAQNATSGMQFRFNIWPGDASFGGNFDPSILPVFQYINWVQYSSYANGAFQLVWREDFSASTSPSGWLTGNWSSPKNLSTDTPANVGFINGYAVLSLTSDDATGTAGAAPADATDTSGGAPSTGGATSVAVAGSANQGAGGSNSATTAGGGEGCSCRLVASRPNTTAAALLCFVAAALVRSRKFTRAAG